MKRPFRELRDEIRADPVRAARLDAAVAEVSAIAEQEASCHCYSSCECCCVCEEDTPENAP